MPDRCERWDQTYQVTPPALGSLLALVTGADVMMGPPAPNAADFGLRLFFVHVAEGPEGSRLLDWCDRIAVRSPYLSVRSPAVYDRVDVSGLLPGSRRFSVL